MDGITSFRFRRPLLLGSRSPKPKVYGPGSIYGSPPPKPEEGYLISEPETVTAMMEDYLPSEPEIVTTMMEDYLPSEPEIVTTMKEDYLTSEPETVTAMMEDFRTSGPETFTEAIEDKVDINQILSTASYITIIVLLVILAGYYFLRYWRRRNRVKSDTNINSLSVLETNVNQEMLPVVPPRDVNSKAKDKWEFPRNKLQKLEHLGEGCFGQVYKYTAIDLKLQPLSIVAVKMINDAASNEEKNDFLKELEILKTLLPHPNVVSLLGCCTEKDPILVILEFMNGGKLQCVLRASRADQSSPNLGGSLVPNDLIVFALQVAKGMSFLSDFTILHRDLATRNVLVTDGKVCKVADFGFARDVAKNNVYERKSSGKLPIRWMAPESLFDNIFTTKSDVWSFGILLWEIVTLASTPYPGIAASDVIKKVREGYRLEKPEHCRQEAYDIMVSCWNLDPTKRPAFKELVDILDALISTEVDYITLDNIPEGDYYYHRIEEDSTELF